MRVFNAQVSWASRSLRLKLLIIHGHSDGNNSVALSRPSVPLSYFTHETIDRTAANWDGRRNVFRIKRRVFLVDRKTDETRSGVFGILSAIGTFSLVTLLTRKPFGARVPMPLRSSR